MDDRLYKTLKLVAIALALTWVGWAAYDNFSDDSPHRVALETEMEELDQEYDRIEGRIRQLQSPLVDLRDFQAVSIEELQRLLPPDGILLEYLVRQQVPLEMCPLSNVRTAVVPSLREHPIRDYLRQGLVVTVNTDDPKMFNNSLALEYALLERELGCTRDEIRSLILNAARFSWLPTVRKQALVASLQADAAWAG